MRVGDGNGDISGIYAPAEARAAAQTSAVEERVRDLPPLDRRSGDWRSRIASRLLNERAGHTSDYDSWIAKVTPPDLE